MKKPDLIDGIELADIPLFIWIGGATWLISMLFIFKGKFALSLIPALLIGGATWWYQNKTQDI